MSRGIEGRDIFADNDDRRRFLVLLDSSLRRWGHRCHAWALMHNHYHLVLRCAEPHLGLMMRQLNSAYARYYGRRHNRQGYLFQNRFRSVATQDQKYVLEMIRYVHLNPVRAGLCRTVRALASYPWTGHAALMGRRSPAFQECKPVLRCFGRIVSEARAKYESFVAAGLDAGDGAGVLGAIRRANAGVEAMGDAGCWVIGEPAFVRRVMAQDSARRVRLARHARQGLDLTRVLRIASRLTGVPAAGILARRRFGPAAGARKVFCHLAAARYGFRTAAIGQFLGIGAAAVSASSLKGGRLLGKKSGGP